MGDIKDYINRRAASDPEFKRSYERLKTLPVWIMLAIIDGYDPEVCHSAAGYYIGAVDEDGLPYARHSRDYYRTREQAQEALDNGTWVPKQQP